MIRAKDFDTTKCGIRGVICRDWVPVEVSNEDVKIIPVDTKIGRGIKYARSKTGINTVNELDELLDQSPPQPGPFTGREIIG